MLLLYFYSMSVSATLASDIHSLFAIATSLICENFTIFKIWKMELKNPPEPVTAEIYRHHDEVRIIFMISKFFLQ